MRQVHSRNRVYDAYFKCKNYVSVEKWHENFHSQTKGHVKSQSQTKRYVTWKRNGNAGLQSNPGLFNLLCGAANYGKIWPACGQHGIQ